MPSINASYTKEEKETIISVLTEVLKYIKNNKTTSGITGGFFICIVIRHNIVTSNSFTKKLALDYIHKLISTHPLDGQYMAVENWLIEQKINPFIGVNHTNQYRIDWIKHMIKELSA